MNTTIESFIKEIVNKTDEFKRELGNFKEGNQKILLNITIL